MRKWRERLKRCSYKPRNAWSCQKLEETRKDSLPEPSEGQHLDVGCLASRTGRINFCVLRHQACGDLSQQPSDTKCRSQVQWVAEGGSVWPQMTCFFTVNEWIHTWADEWMRKPHYSRRSIWFQWQDAEEGDPGQKKKSIAFLCLQILHLTLLILPVHLSLGLLRSTERGNGNGSKRDTGSRKLLFNPNVSRSLLEGEQEVCREVTGFFFFFF